MDIRLIGQRCECCNDVITAEHEDARFYSQDIDEDTRKVFLDCPTCCDACFDDIDDGCRSFENDMIASGLDGDYDY